MLDSELLKISKFDLTMLERYLNYLNSAERQPLDSFVMSYQHRDKTAVSLKDLARKYKLYENLDCNTI